MTRITLNSLLRPAWVLLAVLATLPAIAAVYWLFLRKKGF